MQNLITALGVAVYMSKALFVIHLVWAATVSGEAFRGLQQSIADLSAADSRSVQRAQKDLLKARQIVIAELIRFISDKENLRRKYRASSRCMDILGHYRATEAIETLIDDIGYPLGPVLARIDLGTSFGVPDRYPAVDALVEIGHPAIPALLNRLRRAEPVPGLFHRLTVKVIVAFLGKDGAHVRLKEELVDAAGAENDNLKIALRELQSLPKKPVGRQ
jgi:hypothetical protein